MLAVALLFGLAAVAIPTAGSAHEQPEHSLTVRVSTDTPPPDGTRLCISLFSGGEGDLAEPLMNRCLEDGESAVRLEGLVHGTYRVVAPGPDSILDPALYEGQIVITEVPDEPDVADYAVDLVLLGAVPVPGAAAIDVYACPIGTDLGAGAIALGLACGVRDVPTTFALTAGDTVAASAAAIVAEAVGGATARVENVPPGRYGVIWTAGIAADASVAWFLLPADDGTAEALGAAATIDIEAARDTRLAVFVVDPPIDDAPIIGEPASDPGRDPAPVEPILALGGEINPTVVAPVTVTPALTLPNTGTGESGGHPLGIGWGLALVAALTVFTACGVRRRTRA